MNENQARANMMAVSQLRSMEVGQIVTKEHIAALNHFFGPLFSTMKSFKVSVGFDDKGQPVVDDPSGVIESVTVIESDEPDEQDGPAK